MKPASPLSRRPVTFTECVYTFHIDFNGHVSNIVYVEWMEVARNRLLDAMGLSVRQIREIGFSPVLIETHVTYKYPVFLGDTVTIAIWLTEVTPLHAWMAIRIERSDGALAAFGRQRGIFVRTDTGKPRRLTSDEQSRFEPFIIPDTEPRGHE
jgi:acyl-CoA thioester hydrolase